MTSIVAVRTVEYEEYSAIRVICSLSYDILLYHGLYLIKYIHLILLDYFRHTYYDSELLSCLVVH